MSAPIIICNNDVVLSFSGSSQIASLSASSNQVVILFTWTILSVPPGSTVLTGIHGDFLNGVATTGPGSVSNVSFTTDAGIEGTYVIQCTAVNSSSEESDPQSDKQNAQQNVVVRTESLSLILPNDFQYDWALYNNNNFLILETAVPTSDEKNALSGTSGSPSITNKYLTNSDSRIPTQDENDALTGTSGSPSSSNKYITNSDARIPTQDENDALIGTSGTPSTTNKYVTNTDSRLSDSRTPSGTAGGDLFGTYPNPEVAAIHETSGPTKLTIGSVSDGQFLKRSGSGITGSSFTDTSIWFEWNGTDLSQFGTESDGTQVTSSTWSIVSHAGVNWIQANISSGTATNKGVVSSFLPISTTPPSADYGIRLDVICNAALIGNSIAGVMSRRTASTGIGIGYVMTVEWASPGSNSSWELRQYGASQSETVHHFDNQTLSDVDQYEGWSVRLDVIGGTILCPRSPRHFVYGQPSGAVTGAGQAGLIAGVNTSGATKTVLFRNIRAFTLPRIE